MADHDFEDEQVDYLTLLEGSRTKSKDTSIIPRRGEKDYLPDGSDLQASKLERSRAALFQVIGEEPRKSTKSPAVSTYSYLTHLARIKTLRGNFFDNTGFTLPGGKMMLYPEEALFLMNRGTLEIRHEQNTTEESEEKQMGRVMNLPEAWQLMIHESGVGLERYQTYAYLKRLGYTVVRARNFRVEEGEELLSNLVLKRDATPKKVSTTLLPANFYNLFEYLSISHIWRFAINLTRSVFSLPAFFFKRTYQIPHTHPIIRAGEHFTYLSIFKALKIIPSVSPKTVVSAPKSFPKRLTYVVDFHAYKPSTIWKKRSPGIPEFLIIVCSSRAPTPTITEFDYLLFQSQHKKSVLLFAVVDPTGSVAFLRAEGLVDGLTDLNEDG